MGAQQAGAAVNCSVSASGPVFGIYSPLNTRPTNSNGNVLVTCTLLSGGAAVVNMIVSLSAGSSGSFAARTMHAGTQSLPYNLYFSAAYTQVWGDGTGGSFYGVATLPLTMANPTQQATGVVYGQVPTGQDVGAGVYLDTIVITVNY
jgi:spore coat protein U domain-containing protein, fimbrial subunit CupE1/2/3/6